MEEETNASNLCKLIMSILNKIKIEGWEALPSPVEYDETVKTVRGSLDKDGDVISALMGALAIYIHAYQNDIVVQELFSYASKCLVQGKNNKKLVKMLHSGNDEA